MTGQPATILYLDHTAKLGGGEIALANLIGALDRSRFRPFVVLSENGPLAARLQGVGCEVEVLPLDKKLGEARKDSLGSASLRQRIGQAAGAITYSARLARIARRERASLIHANSLKADIFGGIAGRLARVPVIWHVRDHVNGEYLPYRVAAAFRWLASWLPTVTVGISRSVLREVGAPAEAAESGGGDPARSPETAAAAAAARELAFTKSARSRLSRYQLVYDGCNADERQPAARAEQWKGEIGERANPDRLPIIALVGRITEWKGQDVFIDAAAQVLRRGTRARFQIIGAPLFGEQEYEARLRRQVCDLGIGDAVEFLGFRSDVAALLEQSAAVVHASTLGEPFGQVVIEAMAAARPVIATDAGAIPEIVVADVTGLLVPMGDAGALAAAIEALIADPARAGQIGRAGRHRVLENFTVQHTARKVEALYCAMLATGQ